jgi:hypothetical protein
MQNGIPKESPTQYDIFRYVAISGNALYFLWIFYNGWAEGFAARGIRLASYIGILALLIFNIILHAMGGKRGASSGTHT